VRLVACGHVTLDRLGSARVPGGTAFYAARTWRALGAEALVYTAAGDDFPRDALAGAALALEPAPRTTAFENRHLPDGRRVQRVGAAAPPLDAGRFPPAWRGADAALLGPVVGEIEPAAFARAAGARLTGLAAQGLVRGVDPAGAVVPRPWRPAPAELAGVDVAFVGEDDLAGQAELVARLAGAIPTVVLTRGARGCEVLSSGRVCRVGIHRAREVDPTGAGDVFAAAFLLALARGDDLLAAARLGAAAASIAIEGLGGERLDAVAGAWDRARRVPVEDAGGR